MSLNILKTNPDTSCIAYFSIKEFDKILSLKIRHSHGLELNKITCHPVFYFSCWTCLCSLAGTLSHRKQITEHAKQQEAHGPHRSPEKPVQINTHISAKIWLYHIWSGKTHYLLLENWMLYICKTLSPLQPRTLCAKFGLNWPSGSGEGYENVKSLPTDGQTDDGRQAIRKGWKLKWAKNQTTKQGVGQPEENKQQNNIIHDHIYE